METNVLRGEEADQLIIKLMDAGRPLTTKEAQAETEKRLVRCPDSTVIFLNKLRIMGEIKGERSSEKDWVWWV